MSSLVSGFAINLIMSETTDGHYKSVSDILLVGGTKFKVMPSSFVCPVFEADVMRLPGTFVKRPADKNYIPFAVALGAVNAHLSVITKRPKSRDNQFRCVQPEPHCFPGFERGCVICEGERTTRSQCREGRAKTGP
jgi:hypothetical protein